MAIKSHSPFRLTAYVLIACLFFVFPLSIRAEDFIFSYPDCFKVYESFISLEDLSRIIIEPDIEVDISELSDDWEKAAKIAQEVLKRQVLIDRDRIRLDNIIFRLKSSVYKNGAWYITYNWEYISEVRRGREINRFFNAKVDLKNKTVVIMRAQDIQATVTGEEI